VRINVRGIELYYKVSGNGPPVILLHGNSQDHTIFHVLIEKLSPDYTVYALDSRDHGKSSKVKRLDYMEKMEDVVEFMSILEIKKPILYGFSDGGIIGLLLAIYHPDLLSKLIISGANTNPDGIKRINLLLLKILYFFTRNKKIYLMITEPDISESDLNTISVPTLILAGHNDFIKEEHTKALAENIRDSKLQILEGESHASYVVGSSKIYNIIKEFLR